MIVIFRGTLLVLVFQVVFFLQDVSNSKEMLKSTLIQLIMKYTTAHNYLGLGGIICVFIMNALMFLRWKSKWTYTTLWIMETDL